MFETPNERGSSVACEEAPAQSQGSNVITTPAVQLATAQEVAAYGTPKDTPAWDIRGFQDAMKNDQGKPPWVVEDLLMEQTATLVSAHPHSLKSLSFLYACLEAVITGKVWNNFAAPDIKGTLSVETEDPTWLVEARVRGFAKGLGLGGDAPVPGFHYVCVGPFDLVKEQSRIEGSRT